MKKLRQTGRIYMDTIMGPISYHTQHVVQEVPRALVSSLFSRPHIARFYTFLPWAPRIQEWLEDVSSFQQTNTYIS